jgi:hypothetical protein
MDVGRRHIVQAIGAAMAYSALISEGLVEFLQQLRGQTGRG